MKFQSVKEVYFSLKTLEGDNFDHREHCGASYTRLGGFEALHDQNGINTFLLMYFLLKITRVVLESCHVLFLRTHRKSFL